MLIILGSTGYSEVQKAEFGCPACPTWREVVSTTSVFAICHLRVLGWCVWVCYLCRDSAILTTTTPDLDLERRIHFPTACTGSPCCPVAGGADSVAWMEPRCCHHVGTGRRVSTYLLLVTMEKATSEGEGNILTLPREGTVCPRMGLFVGN